MQQKNENNHKEPMYQPTNFKQWLALKQQQNKKHQRSIQDEEKYKLQRQNLINNAALSFLTQYRELFSEKKQKPAPLEKIPEYSSGSEEASQLQKLQEQLKLSKLSESFSSQESDLSLYTFHPDHSDNFIQKQFESQEDQKQKKMSKIELQKTSNKINFRLSGQKNLDAKKLKRLKRNRLKKLKGLSDKNQQTKALRKLQKMIQKMGIKQFKLNQQQQLGMEQKKQVQQKSQKYIPNSSSSDSSKYYQSDSDQDFSFIKRKIGSMHKELESKQKLSKNREAPIITQDYSWD